MKTKFVKIDVKWLVAALALLALVEGCAEPLRIEREEKSEEAVAEDKDSCRGGACTTGPTQPDGHVEEGATEAAEVCGSTDIRSPADLEQIRDCTEIRGDLNVASVGLSAIGADDLPLLTKITGDLIISGPQGTAAPHLASVTLGKLRTVEGAVIVSGVSVPEFRASGPLQELHLPALERIGARDAAGLIVYQAALKVLDMPALVAIGGSVMLDTLLALCSVHAESLESIDGELLVHYVPQVSPAQLEPLRSAAAGEVRERLLGCCATDPSESVACESFSERARMFHCGGC